MTAPSDLATTENHAKAISVVLVGTEKTKGDDLRASTLAAFIARRDRPAYFEQGDGQTSAASGIAVTLERLSIQGQLAFEERPTGEVEVFYLPSSEAAVAIQREILPPWPPAALKKVARAVRRSPGAHFDFPLEDGGEPIRVFITDWSPCPAACALAIHRHHPAANGVADGFTGRYVRHPLTGDLLPVWVAAWVKPGFGTGAVLVNPAHDRVDLEYGRRVGLPIRFALVPETHDGEPATWPQAPVIKTGRTLRTGPYDGLDVEAARRRYFEVLEARGLARLHDDIRLPSLALGTFTRWDDGAVFYDPQTGRISTTLGGENAQSVRVRISPSPVLKAISSMAAQRAAKSILIISAAAQREFIDGLAPLAADLGLTAASGLSVLLLGPVEPTPSLAHDLASMAVHVSAKLDQPAIVRQQLLDQMVRFLEMNKQIRGLATSGDTEADAAILRAIDTAMASNDLAAAFKALSTLQKTMVSQEFVSKAQVKAYQHRANILFGENIISIST